MPKQLTHAERDACILRLAPIVERCARRLARSTRRLGRDDLTGIAWIAAIDAVDRFDPERGPLEPFVLLRIETALRRELHRRSRFEHRTTRLTETDERPIQLDDFRHPDPPRAGGHHHNPADVIINAETAEHLNNAIIELEPRRRDIIRRRYDDDQPLFRVAATLNISTQRAHQLEHDALDKIRQAFGEPA